MEINEISKTTEAEIVAEAQRRGYTIREAPAHYARPGKRIGGSAVADGPDHWMNAANDRLYQIQTARS